jgi:hypothetical protein
MSFSSADHSALEHLIQEVAIPIGNRRGMSTPEFLRSLRPESNRRRSPRVDLGESDVIIRVENQIVRPVDFSLRGVQFHSDSRLAPGMSVMMHIQSQQDEKVLALGKVMWAAFEKAAMRAEPHYRTGVLLENADLRTIRSILARCGLGQTVDLRVIYSNR